MNITSDLFKFPFKDPEWKNKALIGLLLGAAAMVIFPFYWAISGYSLRVMRQTLRGDEPTLPEWNEWGELFKDGLRQWFVLLVYTLPFVAVMMLVMGFMFVSFMFGPVAAASTQSSQAAAASMVGMVVLWIVAGFAVMIVSVLMIPAQFFALVGLTRAIAHERVGAAFEFRQVWELAKTGFSEFALAFGVWYGSLMAMSIAATILYYTVILACLLPFAYGAMMIYSGMLMSAMFGMAYRHTQEKFATAGMRA